MIQKEGRKSLGYGFFFFSYFPDSLIGFILGISFFGGGVYFVCLFIEYSKITSLL